MLNVPLDHMLLTIAQFLRRILHEHLLEYLIYTYKYALSFKYIFVVMCVCIHTYMYIYISISCICRRYCAEARSSWLTPLLCNAKNFLSEIACTFVVYVWVPEYCRYVHASTSKDMSFLSLIFVELCMIFMLCHFW